MIPYLAAALVTVLALLALLRARLPWWVKAALIVVSLSFDFLLIGALNSYRGWSVSEQWPKNSQFVSCLVETKSIYLWMIPGHGDGGVLSYRSSSSEPRSFRIAYSDSLAHACQQAAKLQASGGSPGITGTRRRTTRSNHSSARVVYHTYQLPPINIPHKIQGVGP